jgi:predicted phosphate transport protein (TIGR00153 family)
MPGWRDLIFPRDETFAPLLREQSRVAARGLKLLARYAETRDDAIPNEMAAVEAEGDAVRRRLVEALRATYATPLDREDLSALSRALDDILDAAEDALLEMALFETAPNAHADEMIRSLVEAMEMVEDAVARLPGEPAAAARSGRKAKQLENHAANLYRYGLYHVFETASPPEAFKLREVYGSLREVAARVARAADVIGDILVKET